MTSINKCSPSRRAKMGNNKRCVSMTEMKSIAALYNSGLQEQLKVQGDIGGAKPIHPEAFASEDALAAALNDRLSKSGCKDDACWIEQPFVKSSGDLYRKLSKNFIPRMPATWKKRGKEREWLDTYDILSVMKQFEDKHSSYFSFLGVFPVDFATKGVCSLQMMCDFNLERLREKGKTSFGMVLNLDKHNEPGSHWVSIFCSIDRDSRKHGICYYDSGGVKPPIEINNFMKTVHDQVNEPQSFKPRYNPNKHQYQNTECGIFSMLFIIFCLENPHRNYSEVRKILHDKKDKKDNGIHAYRSLLYRK